MKLEDWLNAFCKLHERAGLGQLSQDERRGYLDARDELARALLKTQRIALHPGQKPRHSLRAALALPVTLQLPSGKVQAITQDISGGGFSVIISLASIVPTPVPFSLRLSGGGPPIEGKARMVGGPGMLGSGRMGFAFEEIAGAAVERIETAVFDSVVTQLAPSRDGTPGVSTADNLRGE
jgi:hypothetical protein